MDDNVILYDHAHIDSLDMNDLSIDKLAYLMSLKQDIPKSEAAQSIIDASKLEIQDSNTENNSLNSKYLYFYVNMPSSEPFYLKLMLYRNATYDYVATLTYLMKMHYKKINRKSPHSLLLITCKQLLNEYFLWDLLYVLELFHYNTENSDVSQELASAEAIKHQSEYDYVSYLFVKYPDMELAQIIIDWCERCYYIEKKFSLLWSDDFDTYPANIDFLEQLASEIKSKSRKRSGKYKYEPFRLDPDSIHILHRTIPADVQNDIETTNKKLYQYIRSGKLAKAIDLCLNQKQFLKAAVMEGWQLERIENNTRVEGNHMRIKWRQICDRISNNKKYDIYERAFYGAFSNNVNVQMEVMESYRDLIWTYCKYYLDKKISSPHELEFDLHHVLKNHIDIIFNDSTTNTSTHTNYFNNDDCYKPIVKVILESLAPSNITTNINNINSFITENYSFPDNLRSAILETFNKYCSNFVKNSLITPSINKIHFLRFLNYLYLLIKPESTATNTTSIIEEESHYEDFVELCECYFDALVSSDETDLVPFLLTFLPEQYRYVSFSRLLTKVSPIGNKQDIISLTNSTELDIIDMINAHCDTCINYLLETSPTALDKIIEELNDSVEWFIHDPELAIFVVIQTEKVMRHVILHFGLFQPKFNEFIVSKVSHLRSCSIDMAYIRKRKTFNIYIETIDDIIEQFYMEFDVLYSVTAFDRWIHGEKFCDDSYTQDLIKTLENTFYNDKFYYMSRPNLESTTMILNEQSIYGCIVRLWHPYCLLYLGKLFNSRYMYNEALELSCKSTSFQQNCVIDYFNQEQCAIFMDILSEAARNLLEQDKIPINSGDSTSVNSTHM